MSSGRGATTYPIGSPTRRCAATDRELTTGEAYIAALVQAAASKGDEIRREDYSVAAWDGGARPRSGLLLGFWRGIVPEPGAKRRLLIDDASLLELFEQTEGDLDPAVLGGNGEGESASRREADRLAFRFILALILLRKRLLISDKTEGKSLWVRPRGSPKPSEGGTLMEVVDPGLDDASAARVTTQLAAILEG